MNENVEDGLFTVEQYKLKLKRREADLQKAGVLGNQLLENNKQLEEKLQGLQSENERLKQKSYSLQLELQAKSKTLDSQSFESEHLLSQKEKCNKLQKEILALKQTIKNLKNQICDQEELQKENKSLESYINNQKQQIDTLQERIDSCVNATIIEDDTDEIDLHCFKLKNAQLQEILSGYQTELEKLKGDGKKLRDLIKSQEEIIHEKEIVCKSYFDEIKEAREEASELKCEIETLKLQQIDVNQKGNSVFGELDDRRLLVEKHCKKLEERYKTICAQHKESLQELRYCKNQLAVLPSERSCRNRAAHIEKLETQLREAKRNIVELTEELEKSVQLQQQLKAVRSPVPMGDQYNYLKVMHEQSEKTVSILQRETMLLRLKVQEYTESLSETQRNLYRCQEEAEELRRGKVELTQRIEELTDRMDSGAPSEKKPNEEVDNQGNKAASVHSTENGINSKDFATTSGINGPSKSSAFSERCVHCGAKATQPLGAVSQNPDRKDAKERGLRFDTAEESGEIKCPVQ